MKGEEAYEWALDHIEREPDGSVSEDALVELVAANIDFNIEVAKRGKAQRIVARRKRPGQTKPEGQLVLPGMEPFAYEPQRLVADEKGHLVENAKARPSFKAAEARRAQDDLKQATLRARREQEEYLVYSEWAMRELANGRPGSEITWDTCVREMHLWKDEEAEADTDLDEGDEGATE